MTRLRSLIEETGILVLAVVHLKRPDKGKSYNEGRPSASRTCAVPVASNRCRTWWSALNATSRATSRRSDHPGPEKPLP